MPRKARYKYLPIRSYLMKYGPASPYDYWRDTGKRLKYQTVFKYFKELEELGLIHVVGEEPTKSGSLTKKKLYAIVPGKEKDPLWIGRTKTYNTTNTKSK